MHDRAHNRGALTRQTSPPGVLDPESFKRACAQFATGVAIASVRALDGTPHGLTVNSFTSVSLSPPLILVSIDYGCTILRHFRTAKYFAINVLSQQQRALSISFAVKPEGRFDEIEWHPGSTGAPLLAGTLAFLECRVSNVIEIADHAIFIGEVLYTEQKAGDPLIYFDSNYRSLL